jgi:hypothetical protein
MLLHQRRWYHLTMAKYIIKVMEFVKSSFLYCLLDSVCQQDIVSSQVVDNLDVASGKSDLSVALTTDELVLTRYCKLITAGDFILSHKGIICI